METEDDMKTARLLRENIVRFEAPAALRRQILKSIKQSRPVSPLAHLHGWVQSLTSQWATLSAGVASGALATFIGMHLYLSLPQDTLTDEVANNHVRSLMADHLSDVASTDQHTVKPWFTGKLDYAPPVQDFANRGFALVGGRIDYLDHRAVAAMVYRHQGHVINAFAWPVAQSNSVGEQRTRRGFNMIEWNAEGLQYWLVSDLGMDDLTQFARIIRTSSTTTSAPKN